jgi:hypothetical protein
MIGDYRKLLERQSAGEVIGLVMDNPERPGGRPIWSLAPEGERVHATTAKAAKRRGFPMAQADLFEEAAS